MDQKKLMMRVKYKTDNEKLTINSQMYFIADTAVFSVNDLVNQKGSVMMAWLEGETLKTRVLYEPPNPGAVTINKVITEREKQAILIMASDGTIAVISSKDPKNCTPQVIKTQAK
ncbi:MAG: hypothetical protein M1610_08115 [Nitrospirae bacterium]|jgi:hypothetical protein|nr:hypothetical protein [Nitrospirota bacterium]MDA8215382.1 hypothetical protein [Nitrospiraceae bacterium]MDA8339606.1 hypothetical protein [Nitrospiraceae bacterium]